MLEQAGIPDGGAWMLGYEAYLSLAQAWLGRDEPERARAVLAPMLAVADREPWTAALAAALATDGRALIRLGRTEQARAELDRAARLAAEHGLPHVLRDAAGGPAPAAISPARISRSHGPPRRCLLLSDVRCSRVATPLQRPCAPWP